MLDRAATVTYVVEGMGEFPLDMLRRDMAKPATANDAVLVNAKMGDSILEDHENKRLRVYQVKLVSEDVRGAPNTARWESFGCRVVECKDKPECVSAPRKVGRPPKDGVAMSAAERQQRSRAAMRKMASAAVEMPEMLKALKAVRCYVEDGVKRNKLGAKAELAKLDEVIARAEAALPKQTFVISNSGRVRSRYNTYVLPSHPDVAIYPTEKAAGNDRAGGSDNVVPSHVFCLESRPVNMLDEDE